MGLHNDYNELLSKSQRKALMMVGNAAADRSVNAYLVGGSVRDLILGGRIDDLDVCIESGDIQEFCEFLQTTFCAEILAYSEFGTCKIIIGEEMVDVAVARSEVYERNGALPTITHSTVNHDLMRRDFTINSMAMPILLGELGTVIDLNEGFRDIDEKLLRILHHRSFLDDCTRIFRAVRYSKRLGFIIESQTEVLLKEGIKEICNVSGTRISSELIRICYEPERVSMLQTLDSFGILKVIHPEMAFPEDLKKVSQAVDIENWDKTEISCLLLFSSNPEYREAIARSLNMSKGVLVALSGLKVLENLEENLSNADIYQHLITVPEAALRVGVVCLNNVKSAQIKLFLDKLKDLQLSINGDDVISLGVDPGPFVGDLLSQTFAALLNGQLKDREAQIGFVKNLIQ